MKYFNIRDWGISEGSLFTKKDVSSSNKVCLLGQTVVTNLFPNGEDPIGSIIRFNKVPMKVIGVLASKGSNAFGQDQDDVILAPFNTVQRRFLELLMFRQFTLPHPVKILLHRRPIRSPKF
jgi:putative ABC transport system permease protein